MTFSSGSHFSAQIVTPFDRKTDNRVHLLKVNELRAVHFALLLAVLSPENLQSPRQAVSSIGSAMASEGTREEGSGLTLIH